MEAPEKPDKLATVLAATNRLFTENEAGEGNPSIFEPAKVISTELNMPAAEVTVLLRKLEREGKLSLFQAAGQLLVASRTGKDFPNVVVTATPRTPKVSSPRPKSSTTETDGDDIESDDRAELDAYIDGLERVLGTLREELEKARRRAKHALIERDTARTKLAETGRELTRAKAAVRRLEPEAARVSLLEQRIAELEQQAAELEAVPEHVTAAIDRLTQT